MPAAPREVALPVSFAGFMLTVAHSRTTHPWHDSEDRDCVAVTPLP
jgi:hypothetical protein